MTDNLGPLGLCCDCLAYEGDEVPALTIFEGYAVCRAHLTDRGNIAYAAGNGQKPL